MASKNLFGILTPVFVAGKNGSHREPKVLPTFDDSESASRLRGPTRRAVGLNFAKLSLADGLWLFGSSALEGL